VEKVCAFHLINKYASKKLNVKWNGQQLEYHQYPKYLGITLDCSLTYKEHIRKTAAKVSTHNNILQKLTCSQWSASPQVLRTTSPPHWPFHIQLLNMPAQYAEDQLMLRDSNLH